MRFLPLILLCPVLAFAGVGRHVVPSGGVTSGNALTEGTGWTLTWSGATANTTLVAGDTVWIHAGTYDFVGVSWEVHPSGTEASPIIYRNWDNGRVIIRQTLLYDGWNVAVYDSCKWFWGLEFNRAVADTFNAATIPMGPKCKLINCIVKNSGGNATTAFRDAPGAEIYGTIFLFNGQWWSYGGNKNHAYAIYSQNRGSTDGWKHFNDNIMGWGWSYGVHGYSSTDYIQNLAMRGNVVFNAGYIWRETQYESSFLFGVESDSPAPVDSITVCSNYVYYGSVLGGGRGFSLDYGARAATNVKIDSNIVMGGTYAVDMYATNTYRSFTKNVLATAWYPSNLNSSYTDNTWLADRPATADTVIIRMNAYESKRAHVIVYNYDAGDSVSVNPSGFTSGDTLKFYNVQNIQGDTYFQKVYAGVAFNIPMAASRWSIETPLSSYSAENHPTGALPETFPDFGVFLVTGVAGSEEEPVATKLTFGSWPASAVEDATMGPVTVRIEEADGTLVTTDTRDVTIAIETNPSGGTLSGDLTVAAVNGIATFSDLSINNAGEDYTLIATASGLSSGSSGPIDITATPAPASGKYVPFRRP